MSMMVKCIHERQILSNFPLKALDSWVNTPNHDFGSLLIIEPLYITNSGGKEKGAGESLKLHKETFLICHALPIKMVQPAEYKILLFYSTDGPNEACLPSSGNLISYQVEILKQKVIWHIFEYLKLNL